MIKRIMILAALFLGVQALTNRCGVVTAEAENEQDSFVDTMVKSLAKEAESMVYGQYLPGVAFSDEGGSNTCWLLQSQVESLLPYYGFIVDKWAEEKEASTDFRTLLLAEADEGGHGQEIESEVGNEIYQGEGTLEGNGLTEMGEMVSEGAGSVAGTVPNGNMGGAEGAVREETLEELLRAENDAVLQMQLSTFVPHGIQNHVNLESLMDYDTLIQQFYSIDANTTAGSDRLNVEKFLEADMTIPKDSPGPQILIYHTHSQEAFSDSVPGEEATTIMGVGDRLTEILTLDYGYEVLHHRGKYDVKSRDNAYANSLPDIEQVLEDNPTIQVVIDLHRDEMPEGTRLVMDLDGRPTARFMFFNGLSRTKKTGNIAYLYNENLDSNLAFSFQMQLKAAEYYPGLTRRIYLKGYRYNMHLSPKYLLIELGAQNNTVEEAMNACDPLAHILDLVLSGK
ncbi:MAG: stage II sporulation protein P [Lachnospiraceae bacterium]|nr:stage II sporulation protein P [Lachnospiraceae bacterium]